MNRSRLGSFRVVGIDPGTHKLGWGVLDVEGTRLRHVAHGTLRMTSKLHLALRLVELHDALRDVLEEYRPDESAVESLFFAKDATAAAKLGHARGVVLLLLAQAGVPIAEYPPARVKKTVTGRGRASKEQVGMMIQSILGLTSLPEPDASDALAVAVTHAQMSRLDRMLRGR